VFLLDVVAGPGCVLRLDAGGGLDTMPQYALNFQVIKKFHFAKILPIFCQNLANFLAEKF